MIRKLNIALIGCGNWGKNIARNLHQMGSLTCIYDSNVELSEKLEKALITKVKIRSPLT